MKKFIIAPAVAVAATLALGAPAMAAEGSAQDDTQTSAKQAGQGSMSLGSSSIQAREFVKWTSGVFAHVEGLSEGTKVTFKIEGPKSDTLIYDKTLDASPTGNVHNQILAPSTAVPEDYLGTYTIKATTDDGQSFQQKFDVTPSEISGPTSIN